MLDELDDLIRKGNYPAASELFHQMEPDSTYVYYINASIILRVQGRFLKGKEAAMMAKHLANSEHQVVRAELEITYCQWRSGDVEEALHSIQEIVQGFPDLSLENRAKSKLLEGNLLWQKNNYIPSIQAHSKSLNLYEELEDISNIALLHNNLGYSYLLIGDLELAELHLDQALHLEKQLGNISYPLARVLNNRGLLYIQRGKLVEAKELITQAYAIQSKSGNPMEESYSLFHLVRLLLDLGRIDKAKHHFRRLNKLMDEEVTDIVDLRVQLAKVFILQTMKRFHYTCQATEILDGILSSSKYKDGDMIIATALKYRCETLFEELQYYENMEILTEIEGLVNRLYELSDIQNSVITRLESGFLDARVTLIHGDLNESREKLRKFQHLAMDHGLEEIAKEISNFHDQILKLMDHWEDEDLHSRLEKVGIFSFLRDLQRNKISQSSTTLHEPVLLLLLDVGGNIRMSVPFTDEVDFNQHLLGSFISAITIFFSSAFSKEQQIKRIKADEFTLMARPLDELVINYVFRGDSYPGIEKMQSLVDQMSTGKLHELSGRINSIVGLVIEPTHQESMIIRSIFRN